MILVHTSQNKLNHLVVPFLMLLKMWGMFLESSSSVLHVCMLVHNRYCHTVVDIICEVSVILHYIFPKTLYGWTQQGDAEHFLSTDGETQICNFLRRRKCHYHLG